jgi:anti-sigma-K factor RskA
MENPSHVTDLIPAYALGALEPDEVDTVERHLAFCAECAAEERQIAQAAAALLVAPLALSAQTASAPQALRARILERVRGLPVESAPASAHPTDAAPRAHRGLRDRLRALFSQSPAGTEETHSETPAPYHPTGDAELDRILLDLLVDPACAILPAPGAAEPGAFARLIVTPTSSTGVLFASGLRAPAPGKAYQIWLLRDGQPVPNALFTTDHQGRGASLVRATEPVLAYDTVAVTPEPVGGSVGPTGPIVLAGALR